MWLVNTVLLLWLNFGLSRENYTLLNSSILFWLSTGGGKFVPVPLVGFSRILDESRGFGGVVVRRSYTNVFFCPRVEHQYLCSRGTGVA